MPANRPLAVINDEPVLDQLLQLAAVAGRELDRASDVVAARRRWGEASLVLLDEPALHACEASHLPRRSGVVVICGDEPAPDTWPRAVAIGAEQVLTLPDGESWLLNAFTAPDHPTATGRVIAVLGGRGGAGASVLAAAIALTSLRGGAETLLVDGDPFGGGLDMVLGAEIEEGLRWPELRIQGGRVPASALRSALPGRTLPGRTQPGRMLPGRMLPVRTLPGRAAAGARLAVVSCDRHGPGPEPDAMAAVVDAGRRAGDTVVCDLPRHPSPAAGAALDRADLAILVVPAEIRACAAARRVADAIRQHGARLHIVVRGPAPGGLAARDIASAVGAPVLAALRPEPGLPRTLERGGLRARNRGPLARAAAAVLRAIPASEHNHDR